MVATLRFERSALTSMEVQVLPGQPVIGEWCNGNTTDFDSVVPGSSPGSSANNGDVAQFGRRGRFKICFLRVRVPPSPPIYGVCSVTVNTLVCETGIAGSTPVIHPKVLGLFQQLINHPL